MTDDLVAVLRARLNELANAAREEIEYRKSLPDLTGAAVVMPPLMWVGWDDPTFVLAEVEAKRALVDLCEHPAAGDADPGECGLAQQALRLLAVSYADHPDYRDEWAP